MKRLCKHADIHIKRCISVFLRNPLKPIADIYIIFLIHIVYHNNFKEVIDMAENKIVIERERFAEKLIEYLKDKVKEDVEIDFRKIVKSNDVVMDSIVLFGFNETVSRNYYVDELYSRYEEGDSIKEIGDYIIENRRFDNGRKIDGEKLIHKMNDYNYMLDGHLFVRLMNREKSKEFLADKAYIPWLDLAIVFYSLIEQSNEDMASIAVPTQVFKNWNKTLDEAMQDALKLTETIFPSRRFDLYEVMKAGMDEDMFSEIMNPPEEPESAGILIQTNKMGINGATTILYKDCLKEVAEENNVDKIYIIPSSIHECLLIIDDVGISSGDGIVSIIKYVNATSLDANEILSDNLYVYDAHTNNITIWK